MSVYICKKLSGTNLRYILKYCYYPKHPKIGVESQLFRVW